MIEKQYIRDFENAGLGLFVHFGLYSILGKGEWAKEICKIDDEEYDRLAGSFNPSKNWAKNLVHTAKSAGCKYITLTTRHHDGFSLFDTLGLNQYDVMHSRCHRDLVREFVDACNAQGITPFFYHTLLDWHEDSFQNDFKAYLLYLRKSIEILCSRYGKIGGFWFDGMWAKPDEDWEENRLYALIRKYQPDAMIINNTGLSARGALGNIELDSVTFERGKPQPINLENSPKHIASEMCQIFADHWGYAKEDIAFKSVKSIIDDLTCCRRYGSNMLLNVGLKGNGLIREMDCAMLKTIGKWVACYEEAIRLPKPCDIEVENKEKDFLLKNGNSYYLFCNDLPMQADPNVAVNQENDYCDIFRLEDKIRSIKWMDDQSEVKFAQENGKTTVYTQPFEYGRSLVVRVAKIICK